MIVLDDLIVVMLIMLVVLGVLKRLFSMCMYVFLMSEVVGYFLWLMWFLCRVCWISVLVCGFIYVVMNEVRFSVGWVFSMRVVWSSLRVLLVLILCLGKMSWFMCWLKIV